jgi:hypothetical protein
MFKLKKSLSALFVTLVCALFLPSFAFASPSGDQMLIWQGANQKLGATVEDQAKELAKNDLVVVSHGFTVLNSYPAYYIVNNVYYYYNHPRTTSDPSLTHRPFPNPHDCLDQGYAEMGSLLREAKKFNSSLKIFAYVPANADSPFNNCTNPIVQPNVPFPSCPNGRCSNFISWVDHWLALEYQHRTISGDGNSAPDVVTLIDGFFIDNFADTAISASTRDNVLSYVKLVGKTAMVNILTPNNSITYVKFATDSPYLTADDYIFMEGFQHSGGGPPGSPDVDRSEATNNAMQAYSSLARPKGIRLAALASRPGFSIIGSVSCTSTSPISPKPAYMTFKANAPPGSVFQYTNGDLGTDPGPGNVPVHCNNGLFPSL